MRQLSAWLAVMGAVVADCAVSSFNRQCVACLHASCCCVYTALVLLN